LAPIRIGCYRIRVRVDADPRIGKLGEQLSADGHRWTRTRPLREFRGWTRIGSGPN